MTSAAATGGRPAFEKAGLRAARTALLAAGAGYGVLILGLAVLLPPRIPERIELDGTVSGAGDKAELLILAAVAGVWTLGQLVTDQTLPPGQYTVVGMSAYGTGLLLCRLRFEGMDWRPGVLSQQAVGEFSDNTMRRGAFGAFGSFRSIVLPQVEVLGYSGVSDLIVYLDVVRGGA